ncbi:hypothetical protein CSUI_000781 [Cystoisospora suis]|uniref:Uncharacterized protein n=1 Tax=Cystoisospora suis TaxID=483139 RepID=A0A2C6LF58_9APIC|nr:hypothetical protein CSUI_000781 [Cystoisospora suis]
MRRLCLSAFPCACPGTWLPRRGAAHTDVGRIASKQSALLLLLLLAFSSYLGAGGSVSSRSHDAGGGASGQWDADLTSESVSDAELPLVTPPPRGLPAASAGRNDRPSASALRSPGAEETPQNQSGRTSPLRTPSSLSEGSDTTSRSTPTGGGIPTVSTLVEEHFRQEAGSDGSKAGKNGEVDFEATATPEWRRGNRPTAQHAVWKTLEKLFKAWLQKVFRSKEAKEKCKQTKRAGGIPSASNGDSPLKTFGYPNFDEQSGTTWLQRRMPLSIVNGYPAPIRVGGEDYYVQGSYDEITAFLVCFEDYQVIGSKLTPDGEWQDDERYARIYLQIENTREDIRSPLGGVVSPLLRCGFEFFLRRFFKIGRALRHLTKFDRLLKKIASLRHMSEFLPSTSTSVLLTNWNSLERADSNEERLRELTGAVEAAHRRLGLGEEQGWLQPENVDLSAPLTLSFTTYPRPVQGVRATLPMSSNVVTLGEIREQLLRLFESSLVGRAAHDLGGEEVEEPEYEDTVL